MKLPSAEKLESLTIREALGCPPLQQRIKDHGRLAIIGQIAAMILQTAKFINLNLNMDEDQAAETAALLLKKYPIESLEDVHLCLDMAKMGDFGKIYRLDGTIIFEWMAQYLDRKYQEKEKILAEKYKDKAPLPVNDPKKADQAIKQEYKRIQEEARKRAELKKRIDAKAAAERKAKIEQMMKEHKEKIPLEEIKPQESRKQAKDSKTTRETIKHTGR